MCVCVHVRATFFSRDGLFFFKSLVVNIYNYHEMDSKHSWISTHRGREGEGWYRWTMPIECETRRMHFMAVNIKCHTQEMSAISEAQHKTNCERVIIFQWEIVWRKRQSRRQTDQKKRRIWITCPLNKDNKSKRKCKGPTENIYMRNSMHCNGIFNLNTGQNHNDCAYAIPFSKSRSATWVHAMTCQRTNQLVCFDILNYE